jgi:hypothetical protein
MLASVGLSPSLVVCADTGLASRQAASRRPPTPIDLFIVLLGD